MKIEISFEARRDLSSIARQGALRFGAQQSGRYVARLIQTIGLLADVPEIAHVRPGYGRPIRVHPIGAHVIVYEVRHSAIAIVRVLHGRQNLLDHI